MKYIIYARKSTESEDRQIQSIGDQITEMKRIAQRDNLNILQIFQESKSAKQPGRPVFNEMLKFIQQGKAQGILCWKLDRLARNPQDGGAIQWLLQQKIIEKIITFDRTYLPEDNALITSVEFGMANQQVRDLSKNVRRGIKSKLEKGGWPNVAPIGYKNKESSIVVDKKISSYVKRAFELYSTGGYSVKEIANLLFDEGFRSRSGYKYHKSKIHKLLSNHFYYGVMFMHGEYYAGKHQPIISKELFDKAQLVLQGKHHSKRKKHFFALRGFLRCEKCGCLITATQKKGHDYYYCTNGKGGCEEHKKYLRSNDLEKILSKAFTNLKFNPEMIEIAYLAAKEKTNHKRSYLETAKNNVLNQLNLLALQQKRLLDGYCLGTVANEAYKAKSSELQKQEADLQTQLKEIEQKLQTGLSTLEQTKKVFLNACTAEKDFLEADDNQKRDLLKILLWNATIENQELAKISYKPIYQLIANEPEKDNFDKLRRGRDSNPGNP